MSKPLFQISVDRHKISTAQLIEEPDKQKAVASAIKACIMANFKWVMEDITFVGADNLHFEDRLAEFAEKGDGVMIVCDALLAHGKDPIVMAHIRNIAAPVHHIVHPDKPKANKPRIVLIEQLGIEVPKMIARDIEYIRAETPTQAEVNAEVRRFILDRRNNDISVTLEGNGTLP